MAKPHNKAKTRLSIRQEGYDSLGLKDQNERTRPGSMKKFGKHLSIAGRKTR